MKFNFRAIILGINVIASSYFIYEGLKNTTDINEMYWTAVFFAITILLRISPTLNNNGTVLTIGGLISIFI
ncbi:hypothetical protein, partial [Ferroacidibacillus organovorans]